MSQKPDPAPADVVELESRYSFAETLARLEAAMGGAGLTVFARIDHAAGAAEVGLAMPPTIVLIYGNPRGGTPIMQAAPQSALDLPLRVLVREADGRVLVAFHPAAPLLRRAGVPEELAGRLDGAQKLIADTIAAGGRATGPDGAGQP